MSRGLSSVRDVAPDGVPDVGVGHYFSVVVPQVVLDALAVLVDVLVFAVSAVCVVPIAHDVLVDVHVLAVPGAVDLLVGVPVPAVLVDVLVLDVPVHAVLVGVLVLVVVDVPVAVLAHAVLGVVDVLLSHPPVVIAQVLTSVSACKIPPPLSFTAYGGRDSVDPVFVDSSYNDGQ